MSIYKAAGKFKLGHFWAQVDIFNLKGKHYYVLIGVFLPGTLSRFAEAGAVFDFDKMVNSLSYMWTDEYKAPWYRNMYNFRKGELRDKYQLFTLFWCQI